MRILSKEEAKQLLEKIISYSKADECEANLSGGQEGNIRYARNTVTTSGLAENITASFTAYFGKRSGTVTFNEFDAESIAKAVRRAEELARLAPENPEHMPVLEPQQYIETPTFVERTAQITADYRADVAGKSIAYCKNKDLIAAGFFLDNAQFSAIMNSKGLFAYRRSTEVEFSLTVRTTDGTGSGYVVQDFNDVAKFDVESATRIAAQKAIDSRNPKALEPGKYTVILEPAAAVDLLQNMLFNMDARSADEGRSFLSKAGGGTRLGQKLFDERVTIYSDPAHPEVPASPWAGDGRPQEKVYWVKNGVVQNVYYSRYWAAQKGVKAIPPPANAIMLGGAKSIEEMIRSTKRGILVTRLWYIRTVDPQTLLYTGLTRDGTFYIENGKIMFPVKNFRFNESPVIMLNNLEELGKPQRINGNLVPPMKIRDFTFTSLSDAI
ncbi:putative Zn-dependent protease [Thermonema lapsum]|uniref:Putative Zn-dependent protease n=1 Tax=Thermonema lapsum TaxID=28195 RepID=A0A846MQ22_9BACT|nr:TldD/PmbA family protein [Thermonema lapsum]NIK73531.1 putative Zn-dependent protease [Thermonema lapsum]